LEGGVVLKRDKLKNLNGGSEIPPPDGRDELNLAEFPIALLASRPDKTRKTVHFEDRTRDRGQNAWVTRRLVISASDEYGLPTALDDEVILGLIQLTQETGFLDRRVFFSRYRLLRVLGWRNEGKSYRRLEISLRRWLGVTFYYEKAWWDKAAQAWVNEYFHILEQVSFYDSRGPARGNRLGEPALSMFVWNDVVFRSFRSGNLKRIDMELYRGLHSPVAKRLYRLLDKRFYHRRDWTFHLRELACEHIGLSRGYDTAGLKRKLRPAIAELEKIGYIETVSERERFQKAGRGRWFVSFAKGRIQKAASKERRSAGDIRSCLLERGVNRATVDELVANHSADQIETQLAVLDWMLTGDSSKPPRSPAGYLVEAIRQDYPVPREFQRRQPVGDTTAGGREDPVLRPTSTADQASRQEVRVNRYLRSLSAATRSQLEVEALASADPLMKESYQRAQESDNDLLIRLYRRLILQKHVARKMRSKEGQAREPVNSSGKCARR